MKKTQKLSEWKVKLSVDISVILSEMLSSISRNLFLRSCSSIKQCRNLSVTSIKYVRSPRTISSNTNSAFGTYPNLQEIEVDSTPQEKLETKGEHFKAKFIWK